MIKANELRIGNYVQGDGLSIPRLQVFSDGKMKITAYGIALVESGQLNGLQPIPLTPEILEKAGFLRFARFADTWIKGQKLAIQKDSCFWWTNAWKITDDYEFETTAPWLEIKYLHQLQNLYWCLCGEELQIEL